MPITGLCMPIMGRVFMPIPRSLCVSLALWFTCVCYSNGCMEGRYTVVKIEVVTVIWGYPRGIQY